MSSTDVAVRFAAQSTLERLGAAAELGTARMRAGMATAAEQKQRRVLSLFLELLRDANCDLRLAAVEALGRIGDRRAVESLAAVQSDENETVRRAVARTLQTLGTA